MNNYSYLIQKLVSKRTSKSTFNLQLYLREYYGANNYMRILLWIIMIIKIKTRY